MDFFTKVETEPALFGISHRDRLLLLGSCFTDNIGQRLTNGGFDATVNPWGTLYNPDSIFEALTNPDATFEQWTQKQPHPTPCIETYSLLVITFGTAWVYRLKETNRVVANCKKQPAQIFVRQQLDIDAIAEKYCHFIEKKAIPNRQKLLFTVSPIRHRRDGMHANQLSKATLLMAVSKIQQAYPDHVAYFPAYEIMLDELRDYRFYADDMLHPSATAIDYIWQRFQTTYCTPETQNITARFEQLNRTLAHRPYDAESQEYKKLINETNEKIKQLRHAIQN